LFDEGLLLVIAQVQVLDAAERLEVLGGELFEVVVGASSVVVLEVGGISPLEGGVPADSIFVAEGFAVGSAVYVSN